MQVELHILPPLYTASNIFVTKFRSLVLLKGRDKIKHTHNTSVNINYEHRLKSRTERTPRLRNELCVDLYVCVLLGRRRALYWLRFI